MDLRAVATELPLMISTDGHGGVEGPLSIFWNIFRSKLNVSFSVNVLGTNDLGELYPNGTGTGMLGSLLRNETHFSVYPQYLDQLGVEYLDYTSVLYVGEWHIITGPQKLRSSQYFEALNSLQLTVWLVLIGSFFAFPFCWTLLKAFKTKPRFSNLNPMFRKYFFQSYRSFFGQGLDLPSINHSFERLCCIFWILASLTITRSFTGVMYSKLAKKDEPFRYETLSDFIARPNISIIALKNTEPFQDIKTSNEPIKKKIWQKIVKDKTESYLDELDYTDAAMRLSSGEAAYVLFRRIMLMASSMFCGSIFENVNISRESLFNSPMVLFISRRIRAELKKDIKKIALQIFESSIADCKWNSMSAVGQLCLANKEEEPASPLPNEKFIFIYAICGLATGAALIFFFAELLSLVKCTRVNYGLITL